MKNDFGGLLVTGGDVTYVPHQNWRSDTLISQVNLNIVFKLVLSSSSPTNLKIMAHHAKWAKKGNFEKKNNFTLQNRHYWREKHLKY